MSSYLEQIAIIEGKQEELREKERNLQKQRATLSDELANLKSLELAKNGGLPDAEVNSLKMALTIIGKAISDDHVISGSLQLIEGEPEETDGGYCGEKKHRFSISMECGFVEDCAVGLCYTVKITTNDEAVRAIVRSMISSTEYVKESEEELRNYWGIDWDDHNKIILKNPYTFEEYYSKPH